MYNPGPKPTQAALYELTVRMKKRQFYANQDRCIHLRVYDRKEKDFSFKVSQEDRRWACDCCIRRRRLCARLLLHDGEYKIYFHPLPQHLREGKGWADVAYWHVTGSDV
jgi:hypothetical protein